DDLDTQGVAVTSSDGRTVTFGIDDETGALDIDPAQFDAAVASLQTNDITIASGPVTRPTGRGIYFYDPDGFLLEIRCDPA
ncbi:MAG: VOC family protein, partial [Cyanobacteria bacterium J06597_1]